MRLMLDQTNDYEDPWPRTTAEHIMLITEILELSLRCLDRRGHGPV